MQLNFDEIEKKKLAETLGKTLEDAKRDLDEMTDGKKSFKDYMNDSVSVDERGEGYIVNNSLVAYGRFLESIVLAWESFKKI